MLYGRVTALGASLSCNIHATTLGFIPLWYSKVSSSGLIDSVKHPCNCYQSQVNSMRLACVYPANVDCTLPPACTCAGTQRATRRCPTCSSISGSVSRGLVQGYTQHCLPALHAMQELMLRQLASPETCPCSWDDMRQCPAGYRVHISVEGSWQPVQNAPFSTCLIHRADPVAVLSKQCLHVCSGFQAYHVLLESMGWRSRGQLRGSKTAGRHA